MKIFSEFENTGTKKSSHFHQVYQTKQVESDFNNFSNPLFQPQTLLYYMNLFHDGINGCHNNTNLFDFLNSIDPMNFNYLIDPSVNQLNVTILFNDFNLM